MDAQESSRKFKEATALFEQGQYLAAMQILTELNQAWPGNKNVLVPMALCLECLGRTDEALRLGQQLVDHFQDSRAQALCHRLGAQVSPPMPEAMPEIPDILDAPVRRTVVPREAPGRDWKPYLIAGGVVLAVLVIGIPLVMGLTGGGYSTVNQAASPSGAPTTVIPSAMRAGNPMMYVGFALLGYFVNIIVTYLVLKVMGRLRHNDLYADLEDVAIVCIFTSLVAIIPFLGIILALIIMSKHYELSCGELVIFLIVSAVAGAILSFVLMGLLGGAAVMSGAVPTP